MDFRAIVAAWIVAVSVVAGALYVAGARRDMPELAGIEPGVRVPLHQQLPQPPQHAPLESYPGDR
ncbi:MAG: hypothetical protein JNN22_00885 [Rhodospirillales bacterium]|nr:hypothetical protein [Rhodospirillales bacterium]